MKRRGMLGVGLAIVLPSAGLASYESAKLAVHTKDEGSRLRGEAVTAIMHDGFSDADSVFTGDRPNINIGRITLGQCVFQDVNAHQETQGGHVQDVRDYSLVVGQVSSGSGDSSSVYLTNTITVKFNNAHELTAVLPHLNCSAVAADSVVIRENP